MAAFGSAVAIGVMVQYLNANNYVHLNNYFNDYFPFLLMIFFIFYMVLIRTGLADNYKFEFER